jgi:hypothetical protein
MMVPKNIVSPQANKPVIGIVQDTLLGCRWAGCLVSEHGCCAFWSTALVSDIFVKIGVHTGI